MDNQHKKITGYRDLTQQAKINLKIGLMTLTRAVAKPTIF
jgi:hypothetical protein